MKLTREQCALVENNTGLVLGAINRCHGVKYPENDDAIALGNYALCKAAATFDPRSNTKFSTYATTCIIREFYKEYCAQATLHRGGGVRPVSLNQPIDMDGTPSDYCEILDAIPDRLADTEQAALDSILLQEVKGLTPITSYLMEFGFTQSELARQLGVSRQRIGQKIRKERNRLRLACPSFAP